MKHELTYREVDEKGYGDGLDDVYDCTCGETFQANGDVAAAFEHGQYTASNADAAIAVIRQHIPSLTNKDDALIDTLRFNSDVDRYGQPAVENSELALRTCACGEHIDGFYAYVDHLKEVLSGTDVPASHPASDV